VTGDPNPSAEARSAAAADLRNEGAAYQAQGEYTRAERCFREAVALLEEAPGSHGEELGCLLNDLADALYAQGKYDSTTEALYGRALETLERINGRDHPDVANVLNNLAALHQVRGDYRQAEAQSQRSVSILEDILETKRALVAELDADSVTVLKQIHQQSLTHLATALRSQARFGEAERLYRSALAIAEDTFGPQHPEAASSLNNLGVLYRYWGRYDEAEPLYQRARSIVEQAVEADPLQLSSIFYNLAGLGHARSRYAEAEPLSRRALEIGEQALGAKHPDVAVKLSALAAILDGQGKYDEAESLYRRALGIYQEAFGPDHPDVALNLNNLAALEEARGNTAQAETLYGIPADPRKDPGV
jgi:tetratricopeptide (TPR) repeat protein